MASQKSLFIVAVLTIMFLVVAPIASAFEFDNVKDETASTFDGKQVSGNKLLETYKPIKITNAFGLGDTLFEGYLSQHDDFCGTDCQSTMEIKLHQDSVLISDIDFYTILDGGYRVRQDVRSYQFYINDNPYKLGTEMPEGIYTVTLEAEKKPSRTVDWVISTQGETLTEWAVWGSLNLIDGLIYYYNMDDDLATTNVIDILNSSNGTLEGGDNTDDISVEGIINNSLDFDGSVDRVDLEFIPVTDSAFTWVFWINTTDSAGYILASDSSSGPTDEGVSMSIESTKLIVYSGAGGGTRILGPSTTVINDGSWHFIALTHDGTNGQIYVDGGAAEVSAGWNAYASVENLFIGRRGQRDSEYLNGMIDEVGIYNRSLSAADILDLYNSGNGDTYPFTEGQVTLNSPVDDFTFTSLNITFNCSASVIGGATLTNISFWHNITGTLTQNQTRVITGTSNTSIFNLTLSTDGSLDWTCSAGDSDGDRGFGGDRTVSVDSITPTINITFPTPELDQGVLGQNITLNWTVFDAGTLASCWYDYNNTNSTVPCSSQNASFILTNQKNITFYANDSVANEANFTRTWTYKIFGNSEVYNLTTYETAAEGFKLNLTSDGTQLVLADLVYDGVTYSTAKVGNNFEMEFNRNLILPEVTIATAQNKSFYWNVTYGSEVILTKTVNQSVGRIALGLCNATLTTPYLNLTFKDEETTITTNASIDTSTWNYYLVSGDGTVNKTLLYSTTDANESYGFCFTPTDRTVTASLELQYSDTGYPQRRWSTSGSLTNTTSTPTLYMLASVDGTYSVYQVQTTIGQGIEGVAVIVERQFIGVWTLVEQGVTDSAGAFTGWLNPDYDHRLTFTKEGFTTVQVTVRPSSSTYTIIMSGGADGAVYNSSIEGLSWKVYPDLGKVLFPNTTQTFLFNITANLSNIVTCKMEIVNNDSSSLGTTIGCNSQGGNLSLSIPLGTNKSVRAIYSVNMGDGFIILDADAYWIVMTTNIPERGTLKAFFKYSRDLNEFGSDNNRQEFSRIVLFFLILAIVMASISMTTGWDLITVGGSLVFMNFIIWFGSFAGFLTLSYTGLNSFMDQYVVALITGLITMGFIFNKFGGRV